jgi:lipopolysaccharide export system protein LptA
VKFFCLIALVLFVSLNLRAQTNTTLPLPRGMTRIDSQSADFDLAGHKAVYRGHVRVNDPGMKLYSEWLVVDLPQSGGHVNHIVAETNVVIDLTDEKGQTNHATGDIAVYDYNVQGSVTNDTVTLTGNPQVTNSMGTQGGDKIIWDRITGKFHFTNPRGILNQNFNPTTTKTNSSAIKTNFPPGTIQNVDRITNPKALPP